MYLKSIEVQGFKSFANKIEFEFHNGITGIVGPNGSGKSNVADAVRWVLGEQSAKQLRGGNMQDVIFSGTELRKPLGFASVAITLDNADHKLDIEYEEVTVTRRIYRSGESEYLLNGTACRLKDIHELFYDTGIGKEGYSIIGQGQIDKILSGKPEERRELFDEAAGIVKFKRRKNTALKKLADEEQNLVRVTDILSELTRQLEPLEKQSETAKIYLKKKEELKILDINMFLIELERIRQQSSELEEKYRIADSQMQATNQELEHTKAEYEQLEENLRLLENQIEETRQRSSQSALDRQQMQNRVDLLKEQIRSAKANESHDLERIQKMDQDIKDRDTEQKKLSEQKEELYRQNQAVRERMNLWEEELSGIRRSIQQQEQSSEEGKNSIILLLNQRASTKGKIQRYDAMLEQINIRKAQLRQRVLSLKTDETEQTKQMEALEEEYRKISEGVQKLIQQDQELEKKIHALTEMLAEQNRQMEIGQTAYHREESRLESLRNITERYDGYGNSIRKVMEQKSQNPGILGVVADLISAPKKYEVAIETALGGSIQNIVTDNEQTAKYLIEFLKRGKFGRATFLPLTSMNRKQAFSNEAALKEEGVLGLASDLVQFEPLYQGLVSQLLGKTLVIDHIDHAISLARKYRQSIRMVTLEGELLNPGGSMTGGAFRNSSNLLGRRREIEELEDSVEALRRDMAAMQTAIGENRSQRNVLRETRSELQERLQKEQIRQNTAKMNLQQADQKSKEIQEGYIQLKTETQEIERQISEIQMNRNQILEDLQLSEKQEKELEDMIHKNQEFLEQEKQQESTKVKELEQIRLEFANSSQKAEFTKENLHRLQQEIRRLMEEKQQIQENRQREDAEILSKEQEIKTVIDTIEAAKKEQENTEKQLLEFAKEKEKLNDSHRGFFQKRDKLSEQKNNLDKECYRLNSMKEKLEEELEHQTSYMWEEYEITPVRAQEYRMEEAPVRQEIKKDIAELKDQIRKLGNVNVNAIEEYKELLERHTFLENQHTDLVKAADTLKDIIQELDTGMRHQFEEKFREIRIEFDKAFKELFGGGKGTLELMEDEDILEAGIRIVSQPPGKKLQNMMQLSGGEKALTAIALLFAIQNLKPSPFCLLDEIEAALDDSNVSRFAKYLHKLTKNTQFIVITHRRGTMTAADRLYGITMQEKGISTLVSVNLIEKELDK